jgi:hypothetical protein
MAVATYGVQQQAALRQKTEEELEREAIAAARRQRVDTMMPLPMSQEEKDYRTEGDRSKALRNAQQGYEDKKWQGRGLLGAPIAMLMNRKGKKGIEADAEQRFQSLSQARKMEDLRTNRENRNTARATLSDQEHDIGRDSAKFAQEDATQTAKFGQEDAVYDKTREDKRDDERAARERAPQLAEQQATAKSRQDYLAAREMQNVEYIKESRKTAGTAVDNNRALTRMLGASKDGIEGGAADIISEVQNLFVSAGGSAEGLEDVATMEQAVGSMQANFMKELGARGLTDKDMEILRDSLPKMATSRAARERVIAILRKENNVRIFEHMDQIADEEARYPGVKANRPSWYKSDYYQNAYMADKARKEIEKRDREQSW